MTHYDFDLCCNEECPKKLSCQRYYISNHRSKDHHENYKKKYLKLRPEYYDEKRGRWVYPSCADIDIVRRANVRLGRWIRKGKKLKKQNNDRQFEN